MEYLFILGTIIIGYLFPEFCVVLGGTNRSFPPLANILCSAAFGFISAYFIAL